MTTPPEKDLTDPGQVIKDLGSPEQLTSRFDGLLAKLQTPKARAGLLAAINASPSELGEFAVRSALKEKSEKQG